MRRLTRFDALAAVFCFVVLACSNASLAPSSGPVPDVAPEPTPGLDGDASDSPANNPSSGDDAGAIPPKKDGGVPGPTPTFRSGLQYSGAIGFERIK